MASLSCDFFGKKIKNPIILASGVVDMTKASLERAADNGCGAVTTKSLTPEPRKGHAGPNIIEVGHCGLLNAMGYPNPGIDAGLLEFSGWKRSNEALIISIVGKDAKEFGFLTSKIEGNKKKLGASAIEVALSCPHTPGYGTMAGQSSPEKVLEMIKAIKAETDMPVIAKLSPSSPGLGEAAKAAEKAGADAINMGNALGPGMKIDIRRRTPVLGFGFGGMSGPAIKPIAIRCVHDIYQSVEIPIIGTGGVTSGEDAIEMMMAGAAFVGVGSAIYFRGQKVFGVIADEMKEWMEKNDYRKVEELVGLAHRGEKEEKGCC